MEGFTIRAGTNDAVYAAGLTHGTASQSMKMLTGLLAQRNYPIEVTLSGQETINKLVASQFDLLRMDVQILVMDGLMPR